MRNIHERHIAASAEQVGAVLETLASDHDQLWPGAAWAPMVLDRGLDPGSRGGHDGIRYASTLTRWVPRLIMGLACGHTLFGLFVLPASLDPNPLAGIVDDGFVNAIDGNTDRAVTFWFLATGVVLFIVGHLTHWVVRRTGRIPALVGWWTLGLAVPSLVLLPTSPFWLVLALGVLALVAARRDDQAAVELPTS